MTLGTLDRAMEGDTDGMLLAQGPYHSGTSPSPFSVKNLLNLSEQPSQGSCAMDYMHSGSHYVNTYTTSSIMTPVGVGQGPCMTMSSGYPLMTGISTGGSSGSPRGPSPCLQDPPPSYYDTANSFSSVQSLTSLTSSVGLPHLSQGPADYDPPVSAPLPPTLPSYSSLCEDFSRNTAKSQEPCSEVNADNKEACADSGENRDANSKGRWLLVFITLVSAFMCVHVLLNIRRTRECRCELSQS